ncbi:MAG: hypothetical protein J6V09_02555 [Clostridia bacterium]|nr:hypothetical protein [Clostridia bacterium]
MTDNISNASRRFSPEEIKRRFLAVVLIPTAVFISLYFSPDIAEYAKVGLRLCYKAVIGSVFPFIVLTDIFVAYAHPERITILRVIFEKLFKINGRAISATVLGMLCGFPIGVRVARRLYDDGTLSRDECERLIGFSNNTGPAFAISAVGASIRGSVRDGIIIYLSMLLAAVTVGIIFGIGKHPSYAPIKERDAEFNLTESIKNAGTSTLSICSCVVFFSVIDGLAKHFIKNELIYLFLSPLLEVTGAEAAIAAIDIRSPALSLALAAFALSFSGFSVHMQAKAFLSGTDLRMKTYYLEKLAQGLIAAAISVTFIII